MANISTKINIADRAKTKAQLLAELNELRQRIAQCETADPLTQPEEHYRSVVVAMAEGVVMHQCSGEIVAGNQFEPGGRVGILAP